VAIQAVAFDIGDVLGIHGIVHVAAPDSIAAVEALIDHG
jgi:hypothetical protein